MSDKILSGLFIIVLIVAVLCLGVMVSYCVSWLLCKGVALVFGYQANVWGVTCIVIALNLLISAGKNNG